MMEIKALNFEIDTSKVEEATERFCKALEELRAAIAALDNAKIHVVEADE
jgi:hypothetical protein